MGVHITLAGIRGAIGPILGVQLYIWLSRSGLQTQAFLICFATCLAMNVLGACGFVLLSKRWSRATSNATHVTLKQTESETECVLSESA